MPALRRKAGSTFTDGNIPDKKLATDAFWDPTSEGMAAFVNNCDVHKTARLLIPGTAVDAITEQLSSIIEETNCSILMPTSSTAETNVFITSNFEINNSQANAVDDVANCICKIAELAAFAHKSFNTRLAEGQSESRMIVPNEVCGLLCSKGAGTLKNMRTTTKAAIKLNRARAGHSNDRIIEVSGIADRLKEGVVALLVAIRETEFKDLSVIRKFYNANDAKEGDYGGFVPYKTVDVLKEPSLEETSSTEPMAREVQLRVLLPHNVSSRVIGSGGKNISNLRSTYDCILKVHTSNTKETSLDIISNKSDDNLSTVVNCLTEIVSFCKDELKTCAVETGYNYFGDNAGSGTTEIRLLANKQTVGRVIGTKGMTRKQLQREHDVYLKFYEEVCPGSSDRVVQVAGQVDGMMGAIRNIARMLTEEKPKEIKSPGYFFGDSLPGFTGSCLNYGGYNLEYNNGGFGGGNTGYTARSNVKTGYGSNNQSYSRGSGRSGNNNMVNMMIPQVNNATMANMGGMTMFGEQSNQAGHMQSQMGSMGMGGQSAMNRPYYGGPQGQGSMTQMPTAQISAVGYGSQNQPPVQKPMASRSNIDPNAGTADIAKNMGMDETTYKMFKKKLMQEILKDM